MINCTIQSENSTELRDQAEGCQQVVEFSGKAGCLGEGRTWAMPAIQMKRTDSRCVFFSEWRVVCQEKTSWVICWLLKATWQLKQFLGTVHYLAKKGRLTLGAPKQFQVRGYPGGTQRNKEMSKAFSAPSTLQISVYQVSPLLFSDAFIFTCISQ